MKTWLLGLIVIVGVAIGIAAVASFELHEYHLYSMRKRYPFKAYFKGQLLITEDGSPIRFSTQEGAHQYEQDYSKPWTRDRP